MSGKVTDTDHGAAALLARVRELSGGKRVRVGILTDEPKKAAALTLLEVAVVHEFGGGHVPQRSFIRATIDAHKADIERLQFALAKQVLAGTITPDQALQQLGARVASWMQTRISDGIAPALKDATVKAKGSSTPLVDTGQLFASVTWAVDG